MRLPGMVTLPEERREEYYRKGYWSAKTLLDYFNECVLNAPNKVAVIDIKSRLTYRELDEKSNKLAGLLTQYGTKQGGIVSVQLPNWCEFFIAYIASLKVGAIFNPIPITARVHELNQMLNINQSEILIIPKEYNQKNYLRLVEELPASIPVQHVMVLGENVPEFTGQGRTYHSLYKELERCEAFSQSQFAPTSSADDPVAVLFTSGTESEPKAAIHSHNTIIAGESAMKQVLHLSSHDCVFMASPLSHGTGFLHCVNLSLVIGGTSVLLDKFSATRALELLTRERCTFSMGATPFLYDILREYQANQSRYDLSSFRFFLCGGAPVPRALLRSAREAGFQVLSVYGSTESPPHAVSRPEDDDELTLATDGKPMDCVEVRIVDDLRQPLPRGEVGEEASRGPNVFLGYLRRPELTYQYIDSDGWYYSGDLCKLTEDGYIQFVGRKKDMIIRGGQNISPAEVEELLLAHAAIEKVAVVGIPDERLGERSCAFVVLKKGAHLTFEDLVTFLEQRKVAKYKFPEKLVILDELPTTASGKIQKYRLREMLANNKDIQVMGRY